MPHIVRAAVLVLMSSLTAGAQTPTAIGQWDGAIATPGAPLAIAVKLEQTTGAWSGSMDIPAQGLAAGGLTNINVEGRTVRFSLAGVPGNPSFNGLLSEDGNQIAGEFAQGGAKLTFQLTRRTGAAPPPPARPQTPRPPFPYDATEVTVDNAVAGVRLAGTLTTPRTAGPHAAVVLITGSNQQDRDETIARHKPFWVLADYLTRRGVAVLRLDDRGVGGSTGNPATATSEDFAGDIVAAVEFLRTRPGINPSRIGLVGHSEGGTIAPMVAVRSKAVSFLVLMAGSGVPGDAISYEQAARISRAQGIPDSVIAVNRALQDQLFAIMRNEPSAAARLEQMRPLVPAAMAQDYSRPWWRFFVTYDPATALKQITVPTLVLNGERDLQIVASQNLPAIEAALRAAGNTQFTIRSFPNLNHLFQTSQTGAPAEYAQIEETIAPIVLETIADWVGRR